LMDILPEGLVFVDKHKKITAINKSGIEILRVEPETLIGKDISEIFGENLCEEGEVLVNFERPRYLRYKMRELDDGYLFVFSDVTREKKLEERRELQKRLSVLGEFAVSIVHEIRNPLTGIKGFASLLKRRLNGDLNARELLNRILMSVDELNDLLTSLLEFTRPLQSEPKLINLKDVVEDALLSLGQRLNGITLRKELVDEKVVGDPRELKRALLNILINDIEAMEGKGELKIKIMGNGHPLGPVAKIIIEDTGPGIPEDKLDKIFNPFFTTKKEGTGLGLAISQKIIHAHRGEILVENRNPHGARFVIILPKNGGGNGKNPNR